MRHPPSNEYTHGGEPWVMIGPEHAEIFHRAGYSKADVKARLWEATNMPARHMAAARLRAGQSRAGRAR